MKSGKIAATTGLICPLDHSKYGTAWYRAGRGAHDDLSESPPELHEMFDDGAAEDECKAQDALLD